MRFIVLRCPSCREPVADDALFCPACGADLAEKSRGARRFMLNKTVKNTAIPIIAVVIVGLVLLFVGRAGKRRQEAAGAVSDSIAGANVRQRNERISSEEQGAAAFRSTSKALVADYNRKINDLFDKVGRERRQLAETKRLTQQASDILNQIEGKLRDA